MQISPPSRLSWGHRAVYSQTSRGLLTGRHRFPFSTCRRLPQRRRGWQSRRTAKKSIAAVRVRAACHCNRVGGPTRAFREDAAKACGCTRKHACRMPSTCLPHAYRMPACLPHAYHMPAVCLPAYRMRAACVPHACRMPTACVLHACRMRAACVLHV